MVQITDKGKKSSDEKLQLKDIDGESNFMNFYVDEKTKDNSNNAEIKNSSPQDLIDRGFSEIETQVKLELLDKLKGDDPLLF